VPGLSFSATARRLTGTPTTAGSYDMTYRVADADGDTDSLTFTITVESAGGGGGGQETTFAVGDTLTDLPSGFWTPDVSAGGVTFLSSGGNVTLQFNNGGYIEEGDYRYTCQSAGGCKIENRRVMSGTIARTAKGTAPSGGGTEPENPGSGTGSTPGNPPNIEVTREGSNIRVSWDISPSATHYEVWRCDTRTGPLECDGGTFFDRSHWTNLARNITGTSYVDRNPPTSTSIIPFDIHYVVQACNSSGCSGLL